MPKSNDEGSIEIQSIETTARASKINMTVRTDETFDITDDGIVLPITKSIFSLAFLKSR